MRLFIAVDLDAETRTKIQEFVATVRELAPEARWVSAESLHVTLKFIGEKPDAMVKDIGAALGGIRQQEFRIQFCGAGFFPSAKAARVFWVGIQAEEGLPRLATSVEESLAAIMIPRGNRAFSPHLTLARAGGGSGAPGWRRGDRANRQFSRLQNFLADHPSPYFGTMSARDYFLYRSQLSSKGSRYTKIARFTLAPVN